MKTEYFFSCRPRLKTKLTLETLQLFFFECSRPVRRVGLRRLTAKIFTKGMKMIDGQD